MQFASRGVAGEVARAVERVVRPGRVRVAAARRGDAQWLCVLVDGPGRYFELGAGLAVEDFPELPAQGFRPPPSPISRTMSIYRSVARRAMDYSAERGDHIVVLLCPCQEWDELRLRWPAAAPALGAGASATPPPPRAQGACPKRRPSRTGPPAHAGTIAVDGVAVAEPADPLAVPRYGKLELVVSLSNVSATNFYDPDPATGGLDLSAVFTSPAGDAWETSGFYDGSDWRVRFAPDGLGAWRYAVTAEDPSGVSNTVSGSFTCVGSSHHGWPRIEGHYLRFADGHVLFAVGHNTGWQPDVVEPSFAEMAASGENLLSFWLAMPWAQPSWASPEEPYWDDRAPIENAEGGIANYNQAACAYIDAVVDGAEAAGIYLLPTIWSHGQLRDVGHPWGEGWWYNNAYSAVCSAAEFFDTADTPQWRYQRNFYRYLIARWGYSRAVAGWVAVCEIEGTTGHHVNPSQAQAWCAAVREFFAANDPFRRSASGLHPLAATRVDAPSWDSGLDLRSTDSYAQKTDDVEVAAAIGSQTGVMWSSGRPCFHAEFGGDTEHGATQPAHLHNGIWAGVAAGAALTPLVWCDGGNFPMLTPEMQAHLGHLSDFIGGLDYVGGSALAPASVSVDDPSCRGWGMWRADRGFAWIQDTAGSVGGETLTVSGLAEGGYGIAWFDVSHDPSPAPP